MEIAWNRNIKLCADGVYRLSREKFCVCTLGLLAKAQYGGVKAHYGSECGFPTSFNELLLAICSSEAKITYGHLFQAFYEAYECLCQDHESGLFFLADVGKKLELTGKW